jgi:cob(I)alamin adenosyltransferase
MKIYTKTGDGGETSLFAGGRVPKDDARLHAYGTIDELNSILGIVLAMNTDVQIASMLRRVQGECFSLGADLATPLDADAEWIKRMDAEPAARLESEIDTMQAELTPLQHFILPGGTPTAAFLHQARTVCRRAERWMVSIRDELNPQTLVYVNRLSDWLFVLARLANARADVDEPIWESRSDG